MTRLLHLRKRGVNEVVAFELDEEGHLDKETVFTNFGLSSLRTWQEDAGVFVAVSFMPNGLSVKRFKPNTKEHPLEVDGAPGGVGQGPHSEAGGAGRGPSSEAAEVAARRARYARRYVGHDAESEPATVLAAHWLVTHGHGRHEGWQLGTLVPVWINDEGADQRRKIFATVRYKAGRKLGDYVLLRLDESSSGGPMQATPVLDQEVGQFEPYVLVGASARSQEKDPTSTRHGYILSTRLDVHSHMKGDTPSDEGDSGGGCFLLSTGAMFAINVARSGDQCCLLPVSVPYFKTLELDNEENVGPSC